MAVTWKKLAFYDEVATTFLGLSDTPASYAAGDADKYVKVNAAYNALEFGLKSGVASGLATLDADSKCAQDPKLHATSHKSGGGDVVNLDELGAPTGPVTFNSQKATGLAAPTVSGDAARKDEVDLKANEADVIKKDGTVAFTGNEDMAGFQLLNYVTHTVADETAMNALTPVVGKRCFRLDDLHPYVCTVAA